MSNEDQLSENIRKWKSLDDPPEELTKRIDQINSQIWKRRGLPLPIDDFFDNLYQTYQESLDRAGLAEYCLQYSINWCLYLELRGHLFVKHDPKQK